MKQNTSNPSILVDLREAHSANISSLPEIESAITMLMKAVGRSANLTILRESIELVYQANEFNLIDAIQKGGEEGEFLKRAFIHVADPEREIEPITLRQASSYSASTQDLFTWIVNYRRQKSFDQKKMESLLERIDAITV